MSDEMTVTPAGYQGPAQHAWTAGCAGFHEPGPCPLPPLPPRWAPADWSVMLGQLAELAAEMQAESDRYRAAASERPWDAAEPTTDTKRCQRAIAVHLGKWAKRLAAFGQPS